MAGMNPSSSRTPGGRTPGAGAGTTPTSASSRTPARTPGRGTSTPGSGVPPTPGSGGSGHTPIPYRTPMAGGASPIPSSSPGSSGWSPAAAAAGSVGDGEADFTRLMRAVLAGTASPDDQRATVKILASLVGNCLRYPGQEKYEAVKLGNEKFRAVWTRPGVKEYLRASQFVQRGEFLQLRDGRSAEALRRSLSVCEATLLDIHERIAREKEAAVAAAHDTAVRAEAAREEETRRTRELHQLIRFVDSVDDSRAQLCMIPPEVAPDAANALTRLREAVDEHTKRCFPNIDDFASTFSGTDLDHLNAILRKIWCFPHDTKYRTIKYENLVKRFPPSSMQHDRVLEFLRRAGFKPVEGDALRFYHEGSADAPAILKWITRGDGGGRGGGCEWAASAACVATVSGFRAVSQILRVQMKEDAEAFAEREAGLALLKKKPPPKAHRDEAPLGLLDETTQELQLTATQLISDIQGFMEQDWLLRGAIGYEAQHRKEGKVLMQRFNAKEITCENLRSMRDAWEAKLERTKQETGRTMFSTIHVVRSKDTVHQDPEVTPSPPKRPKR